MDRENLNKAFDVTDDQLESWAENAEEGILPGDAVGKVMMGRPRLYEQARVELMGVSFKEAPDVIARLDEKAQQSGKTRSEYIRFLIARDLASA